MPNYSFKCTKCAEIKDQFLLIERRDNPDLCKKCNSVVERDYTTIEPTPQLKIVPNIDWGAHRGARKGEW